MNEVIINKRKIIEVLSILSFVFLFLNDQTIYSTHFQQFTTYFTIISVVFLICAVLLNGKFKMHSIYWLTLLIWWLTTLISSALFRLTSMFFVRTVYWLTVAFFVEFLFVNKYDLKKIFFGVCKIFLFWCLINYAVNLIGLNYIPVTHTSSELLFRWYQVDLHAFIFSRSFSQLNTFGLTFLRMDRPFGEPGIAQIYFNFGLIYSLFFLEKKKLYPLLFLVANVLSMSLMGYVITFGIFIVYLLNNKKYLLCFMFSIVSIIIAYFMIVAKTDTFSYEDRTSDYVFMFNTIVENIPFGIGIGNTSMLEKNIIESTGRESIGFYCGLLYPLAQFGIFGIIYYITLFISIKYFSKNKFVCLAFAIFILGTLLTEPQADEPLIIQFLFWGVLMSLSNNKKIDTEIECIT